MNAKLGDNIDPFIFGRLLRRIDSDLLKAYGAGNDTLNNATVVDNAGKIADRPFYSDKAEKFA